LKYYSYTDTGFSDAHSVLYYRLKQSDNDGLFSYSPVIRVQIPLLTFKPPEIHFDQSSQQLFVSYLSGEVSELGITLTDISGNMVFEKSSAVLSGSNLIPFDLGFLSPGIYVIALRDNRQALLNKTKIIKQ
jgi:hypothetical protein